ncbi:MAG: glycosyltransferase family protein [Planctomycetota bacterium]
MHKPKRILAISDTTHNPAKTFQDPTRKLAKGFIRLGHDVIVFCYLNALFQASPIKSKTFASRFFKSKVDELLVAHVRNYRPDIVFVCFPRVLDAASVLHMRRAAPDAVFVGIERDPWPKLKRNRIEVAKNLDILFATSDGEFLQAYKDAGVPSCVFMPNACDPDVEYRYKVSDKWKSDILFTGKIEHVHYPTEDIRPQIVGRLATMKNCAVYGCCGRPPIYGVDYFYAISGARVAVSINVVNSVRLYHSNRLTHYLACGTFTLAKAVPDSDLLFEDGVHLKYFDTVDEFFELADWYLEHEQERERIAQAGMQRAHREFNCEKVAKYIFDIIETGSCSAPWTS